MRIITIMLLALAITACASKPSLEELEEQAMVSGDWEAVEHREEMVKNRRLKSAPHCPRGQTKVCIENGTGIDCYCSTQVGGR
jgi:hypothetical protein